MQLRLFTWFMAGALTMAILDRAGHLWEGYTEGEPACPVETVTPTGERAYG